MADHKPKASITLEFADEETAHEDTEEIIDYAIRMSRSLDGDIEDITIEFDQSGVYTTTAILALTTSTDTDIVETEIADAIEDFPEFVRVAAY